MVVIKFDYVAEVCRHHTSPSHYHGHILSRAAFGGPSDPGRPYFTAMQPPAPASYTSTPTASDAYKV